MEDFVYDRRFKKCLRGGGNGVKPNGDEVLERRGLSEGDGNFVSEESYNRGDFKHSRHTEEQHLQSAECWLKTQAVCKTFQPNEDTFNANVVMGNEESQERENFINNAIFRFAQDDETKHVIVSESETIQLIDNQNQLQENKYAPTSKSKISVLPQGVDMRSNSSPQRGGEFADGRRKSSPGSLVFPRPLWERARVRGVSKNNNKLLIIDWIVSHTLTMTKNFTNSAILRGLNNCSPQNDGKNSCRLTRGDVGKLKCKVAFTLAEGATHVALSNNSRKMAFTLAEVLITLGIIGVVAAMTLPTVINKCQSYVLKQQFKKAYSTFYNAIKLVQVQNGSSIACYYWEVNPYDAAGNPAVCVREDESGNCLEYRLKDGSPLQSDHNGQMSECKKFNEDLMKTLKVVKFCEKEALKNGCLTESYRGVDKVKKEQNPDTVQNPNTMFSDTNIKNKYPAFITTDGVLYIKFDSMSGAPIYTFDVNGHKGPNKWGYDIFSFTIKGNKNDGITKIDSSIYAIEKGGKSMYQMMNEF